MPAAVPATTSAPAVLHCDVSTDADILERLATDPAGGYPEFVRAHADLVYTVALRCSGSPADADDLAQEAFVRAYRALGTYPAERIRELSARAWLATIVTNLWRNELRRRSRRPRQSPLEAADLPAFPGDGPEDVALGRDGARNLSGTLLLLPHQERIPIVLRHVSGLSYAEIAEALGCPEGTAKARVHRGLASLRRILEEAGAGGGTQVAHDTAVDRRSRQEVAR